jgi:hypothetical protein
MSLLLSGVSVSRGLTQQPGNAPQICGLSLGMGVETVSAEVPRVFPFIFTKFGGQTRRIAPNAGLGARVLQAESYRVVSARIHFDMIRTLVDRFDLGCRQQPSPLNQACST